MATYCFVTLIVPATTSLPLGLRSASVHVPELFFASKVRASPTSASSLGGKSSLCVHGLPFEGKSLEVCFIGWLASNRDLPGYGAVLAFLQRQLETSRGPSTIPVMGILGEQFVGVWSGHWDGAGSTGGFELTLEKGKDGAVTGKVSVTGEPTYKANFKALSFEGKTMNAKYDFPPSDDAEVGLALTFDAKKSSGTWTLRAKANGSDVVAGTIEVTKQ